MYNKQRINIAAALDSNYMRYTYVMLTSLFENQPENLDIHIFLLQSNLTDREKKYLEKLVNFFKGTLHWLHIDHSNFPKSSLLTANWPLASYYRLMLQDILPEEIDRILYLDVDIIINKSLLELYNTDFEENALCACSEPFSGLRFLDYRNEVFKEQIKKGFIYFNSGVLLLNVSLMRKKYHLNDYLEIAKKFDYRLETPDQDLLNYVHWKDTKIIDASKYNLYARFAYNCGVHYKEVIEKVVIVHFLSGKPWSGKSKHFDLEKLWWDYAKKTPFFYEFIEEFINESGSAPEAYVELVQLIGEEIGKIAKRKTRTAIQYMSCLIENDIPSKICQNGFSWTEIPYEKAEEYEQWMEQNLLKTGMHAAEGIVLKGKDLDEESLFYAFMKAEEWGASYVVINTEEVASGRHITDILENCLNFIIDKDIEIYLENGYLISKSGIYQCSVFSDIDELKKIAVQFNRICEKNCVGISLNIGNANLLAKNLLVMVDEAGALLKLIHANDNDGYSNDRQIPFSFTKGRETGTTNWFRLIESLVKNDYKGRIVFDVTGVFEKAPKQLYSSFISLLGSIADEWEQELKLEESPD